MDNKIVITSSGDGFLVKKMSEVYEKKECRLCDNKKLIKSIDLGLSPLANQFLKREKKLPKYPLKVLRCNKCHHLQLSCRR